MSYRSQHPRVYIMPPSDYWGKNVRVLRSRDPRAVGQVGYVCSHNTATGVLSVMFEMFDVWTHVSNVELVEEKTNEQK